MDAVVIFESVNLRDVRMVERREHLRFALEAREPVRVLCERSRQHLQRDVAVEPGVAGTIDLAHSAFAQLGHDLI